MAIPCALNTRFSFAGFLVFFFLSLMTSAIAHAAPSEIPTGRSRLEIMGDFQLDRFSDTDNAASNDAIQMRASVGLDWPGWRFVSIHARFQLGALLPLHERFHYRHHNQTLHADAIATIALEPVIDIHDPGRHVALQGALNFQTSIVPGRMGIFTIQAGAGLASQPFYRANSTLHSIRFGAMVWFPLFDDYTHVFNLDRGMCNLSLNVTFIL